MFGDGVQHNKGKSGKYWAILFTVANLAPAIRNSYKNLVPMLLINQSNPDFIQLFSKHMSELETVIPSGIDTKDHGVFQIKIRVLIADAPARAKILNTIQFNGKYGCLHCYNPGRKVTNSCTRRYIYNKTFPERTNEKYLKDVASSTTKNVITKGVKGPCYLSQFLLIPENVIIDYMHLACLGTMKKLCTLWFDTKYNNQEYYIGELANYKK